MAENNENTTIPSENTDWQFHANKGRFKVNSPFDLADPLKGHACIIVQKDGLLFSKEFCAHCEFKKNHPILLFHNPRTKQIALRAAMTPIECDAAYHLNCGKTKAVYTSGKLSCASFCKKLPPEAVNTVLYLAELPTDTNAIITFQL